MDTGGESCFYFCGIGAGMSATTDLKVSSDAQVPSASVPYSGGRLPPKPLSRLHTRTLSGGHCCPLVGFILVKAIHAFPF